MTKLILELSKKTLGSYVKKASEDSVQHHASASMYTRLANSAGKGGKVPVHKAQMKANEHSRKHLNRATNIPKAVERLVKEMLGDSHPRKAYLQPDERQKYTNAVSRPTGQKMRGRYIRKLNKSTIRESDVKELEKTDTSKKTKKGAGDQININPDNPEILKGQIR